MITMTIADMTNATTMNYMNAGYAYAYDTEADNETDERMRT